MWIQSIYQQWVSNGSKRTTCCISCSHWPSSTTSAKQPSKDARQGDAATCPVIRQAEAGALGILWGSVAQPAERIHCQGSKGVSVPSSASRHSSWSCTSAEMLAPVVVLEVVSSLLPNTCHFWNINNCNNKRGWNWEFLDWQTFKDNSILYNDF